MQGINKVGAFDIDEETAKLLINQTNQNGLSNSDVVKPWINAEDITGRSKGMWIIDFGVERNENKVSQYEAPYKYIKQHVYPVRSQNNRAIRARNWWLFGEPVPKLRPILKTQVRYIVTPRVAKHRIFAWATTSIIPDTRLYVFAREDDYFFGVLHSRLHEMWALSTSSRHGIGNDPTYNNSTCFETFPFPWPPGHEDSDSPAYQAIRTAAKQLDEERTAWLNPPGASERDLKDRTLTNLYNALNVWRGKDKMKIKVAAGDFAPRLDELHNALDKAVCDAYGWPYEILSNEEAILGRLLALNLERAGD